MRDLDHLSDDALFVRCERMARLERRVTAGFVACLAEIDRRRAYEGRAYGSVFDYCVKRLRLSEGAAGRRAAAARAARKRLEVLSYLQDGTITLWALCRIEPFLHWPDGGEILSRASRLDRAGLESLVLELSARREAQRTPDEPVMPEPEFSFGGSAEASPRLVPMTLPAPDRIVTPSPGRVRISFEATSSLKEKLERTGTLLSHRLRTRRMEELIELLADFALRRLDPALKTGRSQPAKGDSRRVPWVVRKEVWERDGGRCAFTAEDGTRCGSTSRLQYDHVTPWALGGRSDDAANIRLLCRAHNLHLARKTFGDRAPARASASAR